jgi:hypothetical protein
MRYPLLALLALLLTVSAAAQDYSSPEATLQTYLAACKAGDFAAADQCYTASSREFLAKTPALTQNRPVELLTATYGRLSKLKWITEKVNPKRAILRPDDSKVPPFFLRQQAPNEGWRIDWHFMANYIRADESGWSWVNPKAEGIWKSRE